MAMLNLKFSIMIVNKLEGAKDAIILQKEEMKFICGGKADAATFHCSCTGSDGVTHESEQETIEDCWNSCN